MEGVGAAREVERLCREHRAYRWICGGVPVNYPTLSDFRVVHGPAFDDLLTQTIAVGEPGRDHESCAEVVRLLAEMVLVRARGDRGGGG